MKRAFVLLLAAAVLLLCGCGAPFTGLSQSTVVDSGQERAQVDLHSLPKGVYAVQLTTEDAFIKGSTLIRR